MFILRLELGLGVDYLDHELPMAHYYSQEGCAYISCWHCMDFLYGWCVPFTLFYFLSNFSYFFSFSVSSRFNIDFFILCELCIFPLVSCFFFRILILCLLFFIYSCMSDCLIHLVSDFPPRTYWHTG